MTIKKFDPSEYNKFSINFDDISIDMELQTLHCNICSDWLRLEIRSFDCSINDIRVTIDRLPILVCPKCSRNYLSSRSKVMLKEIVDSAKEKSAVCVNIKSKNQASRRFQYCNKVDFIYDSMDYDYIPGLQRPWDDGALTPVFFNKKVLLKYADDPKYSVIYAADYGSIYEGRAHLISFGINRNGKIICWLGDLDKLSSNEQYYFRSYNMKSDHDITSGFYLSQIEANYGELSKEQNLLKLRSDFQGSCLSNLNLKIFQNSVYLERLMRGCVKPIMWTDKEFSNVINNLNKICVETINTNELKAQIRELDPDIGLKGLRGLKLLEHWIRLRLTYLKSRDIMLPFFVLNDLRQIANHLIVEKKKKDLKTSCYKRLKLTNCGYESIYDSLVKAISDSYMRLNDAVRNQNIKLI